MAAVERERAEFSITFEGPALQDGRMEVRELAPALLALGELLQQANAITYPAAPNVSLEIRAFGQGSFGVTLNLAQEAAQTGAAIIQFFNAPLHTALSNIIAEAALVIAILKRTEKVVERKQVAPGVIRVIYENGITIEVPTAVLDLTNRQSVRRDVRELVKPLRRPGVDRLRVSPPDREEVVVERSDVEAFEAEVEEGEAEIDQEIDMLLSIVTVSFREDNTWRLSDGTVTFFAAVEDPDFLKRVDAGEIFAKGDTLRCRVRMRQWRTDGGLRAEYIVTRVIEHIPRAQALQLPLHDA